MSDEVGRVYLYVALISTSLSVILSSIALVKEFTGQGSGLYVLSQAFESLPADVQLVIKVFLLVLGVAGFLVYKSSRERE